MANYIPPLFRKKQVSGKYKPDTFRVISRRAEGRQAETNQRSHYQKSFLDPEAVRPPQRVINNTDPNSSQRHEFRSHRPHPTKCSYLREDVMLLNEPICFMHTKATHQEQNLWWPARISTTPLKKPPFTYNTTFRSDFMNTGGVADHSQVSMASKESPLRSASDSFLWRKPPPALKEKLSYEHDYNSRTDPNYPIRNKRVGHLVWRSFDADDDSKTSIRPNKNKSQVVLAPDVLKPSHMFPSGYTVAKPIIHSDTEGLLAWRSPANDRQTALAGC